MRFAISTSLWSSLLNRLIFYPGLLPSVSSMKHDAITSVRGSGYSCDPVCSRIIKFSEELHTPDFVLEESTRVYHKYSGNGRRALGSRGVRPADHSRRHEISDPAIMKIQQDGNDISFYSSVQIGSKGKTFALAIDTGSADTWCYSSDCSDVSCLRHRSLGESDSNTLHISVKPFSITYGSGAVTGRLGRDTLRLAGAKLENFQFGLADSATSEFETYTIDGILGLALPAASQGKVPGLIETMVSQGVIHNQLFGISLDRARDSQSHSYVTFGAVDNRRIRDGINSVTFNRLVSDDGLWHIGVDDVICNDIPLDFANRTAVIDTATSLVFIPYNDSLLIHRQIPDTRSNGETFYIPCETDVKVEFQFGGTKYQIAPQDFVGKVVNIEENLCLSHIVGKSILPSNAWLIGATFLKNVYSVFDVENLQLGFGFKQSASTEEDPPSLTLPSFMSQDHKTEFPTSVQKDIEAETSATSTISVAASNQHVLWAWCGPFLLHVAMRLTSIVA